MGVGSNGIIFDDLEWPVTRVSRSLYTYKSNISKKVRFSDKFTKEHWQETIRNLSNGTTFNDLEWPLTLVSFFLTLNISETTRDRATITIERQQEVICALSHGDISNDLDGSLTWFSRSLHFWSWIYQKRCVLGTKLLKNTNRKPYTIYRMVPLSITLSDLLPRFQGHIFWSRISLKKLKDKVTIAQ